MSSTIPMVNTVAWHASIQTELEEAALTVLRSGRFIMGSELAEFEHEVASYLGCQYAIGCANGTDALVLALKAADIGEGDEVITTPFSFFATAEAIAIVGAKPVFVDIDSCSFNLDPALIENALSVKTRAVLAVHIFGCPADIDAICQVCERHKLLLIEDCAQSFGAKYRKQKTGSFGLMGCFSFFPSKNLGGFGDGGLITTDSTRIADKLRQLRNHGSRIQYHHDTLGYNSRLDEIQAALLRIKLRYIDDYNHQRCQIAQWYKETLDTSPFVLPDENSNSSHTYNQYTILTPGNRDAIRNHLDREKIASSVFYPIPLYQQEALCNRVHQETDIKSLPVCEYVSKFCLSLPIFPGMTYEQVRRVAETLSDAVK